jgi:hypothetical protein
MVNETLPTALTQFGDDLERAITRELSTRRSTPPPRRPQPRHWRMRVGIAACCVGASAAAVVVAGGGSAGSAWDQHVIRAAEIALPKPTPNTIVHVSVTQTMTPSVRGNSALLVPILDAEGWFQQGAPYRSVTREQVAGQTPTWQTSSRLYDPATQRVYVDPQFPSSHPRYMLTKAGRDGLVTLRIATSYGPVRETLSSAQARGLRTGADLIQWIAGLNASHKFFLSAGLVPKAEASNIGSAGPPSSTSLTFPARLQRLLQSGNGKVIGRTTIDGRAAIKIVISGVSGYHRMTYYVDPATYRPIELDEYEASSSALTRIVFHSYQQLPIKGNLRLLRLPTPPGTTVDHNPTGIFEHTPPLLLW